MDSTKVSELSSTGKKIEPTGRNGAETVAGKESTSARSGESRKSTRKERADSYPTVAEHLPILQEDLRVLKLAGAKFTIIPNLEPIGKLVIVFDDIGYEDGDLFVKSHGN